MKARATSPQKERALPGPSVDSRIVARATLCLLLLLAAIFVGWHFLTPLAWAVVVNVAAWPAYRRFVLLFAPERRDLTAPLLFTANLGA